MKTYNLKNFKKGWFIGNFTPSLLKTKNFEIGYKEFKKEEYHPKHFHKKAIEYNLIVYGKLKVNGKILKRNSIFIIEKNEVTYLKFLEDCGIFVIKIPSIKEDKYLCH